jgi:hypothetical protein
VSVIALNGILSDLHGLYQQDYVTVTVMSRVPVTAPTPRGAAGIVTKEASGHKIRGCC